MNESQHESNSDENDSEIIDLDAQRPCRFSSTSALRRGVRHIASLLKEKLIVLYL